MNDSLWYQQAVFYQVYVRALADGNGDGHGDLVGLTTKLDYFKDLGVDCLWLMPTYPSPLLDDGYDIADYYNIHPDYGTLADFKTFLAQAHARGLRVIADLVLNHTSDQHPWFQSARASQDSPYRDYYVWSDNDQKYAGTRIIFLDTEKSNWTWDEAAGQYFWHRFYASQPDLNYDNPAVRAEMLNVIQFWLDLGLDGFRADAVPYLFEREGTTCENLPETHAFLKEIRRFVDEHYPGRILLAEANQWPNDLRPYFGEGEATGQAEFHMAFHFPVMPRLYMALAKADRTPVVDILAATPSIPATAQWCTFLRNHDELTLEMVTLDERHWMWNHYAPEPRMRINLGIRRRLAPLLDGDPRKIALMYSLLLTLPGSPVLYYGDEIGMGDDIWLEDRNGVRTPMQWDATSNAGFSTAPAEKLYAPVIDDQRFSYRRCNVEAQRAQPDSLWNTVHTLLAIRRQAAWPNDYQIWPIANLAVLALQRGAEFLAIHNLSSEAQTLQLNAGWADPTKHVLAGERTFIPTQPGLRLPPFGYLWLSNKAQT
jgi:maltose alpha-D-glucosyltransferase/alpha-amylase